jgi:hypothetical protein
MLLQAMQTVSDALDHVGLASRPTLAHRVGFHALIEQFVVDNSKRYPGSRVRRTRSAFSATNYLTTTDRCSGCRSTIRYILCGACF